VQPFPNHSSPAAAFLTAANWLISKVLSGKRAVIFQFSAQGFHEVVQRAEMERSDWALRG
jgi:hypothetical protein